MFTLMIRVTIILIVLLLVMRLMGKKTLGEMQPYEFVITLVISELACTPMADPAIPLWFGIVPILVLLVLHFVCSWLSRKSFLFRKVLDGSPVVVISEQGVEYETLKSLNMNIDDLIEATTTQGYFDLADISVAYFQTNGSLCIIPAAAAAPPTLGDLGIVQPQTTYSVPFVEDGKLCNLDKLGLRRDAVVAALDSLGYAVKDLVVATADAGGKVYLKPKKGAYVSQTVEALAHQEGA